MRYGNVEKILVFGILVVIGLILVVAIQGARKVEDDWENQAELAEASAKEAEGGGASPGEPGASDRSPQRNRRGARTEPGTAPGPGSGRGPAAAGNPRLQSNERAQGAWEGQLGEEGGTPVESRGRPAPPEGGTPLEAGAEGSSESERGVGPGEGGAPGIARAVAIDPEAEAELEQAAGSTPPGRSPSTGVGEVPPAQLPLEYVVQKGDTLQGIAQRLYGDRKVWDQLFQANRAVIESPTRMRAGMTLRLPMAPTTGVELAVAGDRPTPRNDDDGFSRTSSDSTYEVKKSDTLYTIARRHYGTERAWRLILQANADVIADANHIKIGQKLRLPEQLP